MTQDQTNRAMVLTAIANAAPLPYLLDVSHRAREEAHSRLAELACDLGERSMRPHKPKRHRGQEAVRLLSSLPVLIWLAYVAGRKAARS